MSIARDTDWRTTLGVPFGVIPTEEELRTFYHKATKRLPLNTSNKNRYARLDDAYEKGRAYIRVLRQHEEYVPLYEWARQKPGSLAYTSDVTFPPPPAYRVGLSVRAQKRATFQRPQQSFLITGRRARPKYHLRPREQQFAASSPRTPSPPPSPPRLSGRMRRKAVIELNGRIQKKSPKSRTKLREKQTVKKAKHVSAKHLRPSKQVDWMDLN